jgi:hypothetical protein
MANQWTNVIPKLLAMGLETLREQAIMPMLVNRQYEELAGQKGSTVDIPIASAVVAVAVTPSNVPPTTPDQSPTTVAIVLDQWYEAPFYLTDKDFLEVMAGVLPMQAAEAIKALANVVDRAILALYKKVPAAAGQAGTTPFATDLAAYLAARNLLNKQLAPMDDRAVVLNPDAEANAIGLRAFQDASFRGDTEGIINGQIGKKLGATWVMDQNVPTHTAGTYGTGTTVTGANPIGTTTLAVSGGATGTLTVGDIITIAGSTQQYSVVSTVGGGTLTSITIFPGLVTATAGTEAISQVESHVANLLFHRDAFALASRPMAASDPYGLGRFETAIDPVSRLALRLEVTREHKRTRFSYDILYGVQCVRPELAVRILG